MLAPAAGSRIRIVSNATESKSHGASPEFVATLIMGVSILLTVIGQAAWLGAKIERLDAGLAAKIERMGTRSGERFESTHTTMGARLESLHAGQVEIRERLAALEARSEVAVSPNASNEE